VVDLAALIGLFLIIAGIACCALPIIPGPPLSYAALILLSVSREWKAFSKSLLLLLGIITLIVTAGDYVIPLFKTKKYGASRLGLWGGVIGMLAGILFISPYGPFIGAIVGAAIGEIIASRNEKSSVHMGPGVFIGTVLGILYRLSVCGIISVYFRRELFALN
jgi:uncharacterized protein YqgC (DUF456 family)